MFYLVYKITNNINGKYYIGCHKTSNKNDGYFGSGKLLKLAIKKYGIENFSKEILAEFSSEAEMYKKEKELVVLSEQCYNLKDGGEGGFSFINDNNLGGFKNRKHSDLTKKKISNKMKGKVLGKMSDVHRKKISNSKLGTTYKSKPAKSSEHKEKLRNANLNKKHNLMTCPQCGKVGGERAIKRWHKVCAGVTQW